MNIFQIHDIAITNGGSQENHFIGSIIGAATSLIGGDKANKSSAKEAEKSRLHSNEQMQNRHRWEVNDLRKAGLNPVLSAGGTPSVGSSAMAAQRNIAEGMSGFTGSDPQGKDAKTNRGKLNLEKEIAKSQIELLKGQASSARAAANNQNAQAGLNSATTRIQNIEANVAESLGIGANTAVQAAKMGGSSVGKIMNYINPKNLLKPFKRTF